jgi:hypothetical protein
VIDVVLPLGPDSQRFAVVVLAVDFSVTQRHPNLMLYGHDSLSAKKEWKMAKIKIYVKINDT